MQHIAKDAIRCSIVRVVNNFKVKDGGTGTQAFTIHRKVVLSALHWLRKYNCLYKDIVIAEDNFDWMKDGCRQDLLAQTIQEDNGDDLDKSEMDMGPTSDQIEGVLQTEEYIQKRCLVLYVATVQVLIFQNMIMHYITI